MNIKSIAKVELHRHLDCSMRPTTMMELLGVDFKNNIAVKAFSEKYLIESPQKDLATVIFKFKSAQQLLRGKNILRRLAFECVEDAYNDGVRILELRYSPNYVKEVNSDLNFEDIHNAFVEGIESAQKKYPIAVGLIIIIQRTLSVQDATLTMNFATQKKLPLVVAVDLADVEDYPAFPFLKLFEQAKVSGLKITMHAGEVPTQKSIQNIKDAIEIFNVDRIGHGIQSIHSKEICDLLISKNIPLEVCPSSNVLTQGVLKIEEHPIKKLWDMGVPLTLNTDDPGIFNLQLNHEYHLVSKVFGFKESDFVNMNQIAFNHSFIDQNQLLKFKKEFFK